MSDSASSPLLASSERPTSKDSRHSRASHENTPLLSRPDDDPRYDGSDDSQHERLSSPAATSLRSLQIGSTKPGKNGRRWPTVVAVIVLGIFVISIVLGAFFTPAAVEEYAKEALVIEPTNLSIHSFTPTGVKARVQANFRMDASRVKNKNVRNLGRFGTWIARAVETRKSNVEVYLPEYGNILVGTATVPPVVVDIRNGHITEIDFLADLEPGDLEGLRQVANDWLEGRLGQIRLLGKANIALKSGLFSLGSQAISESLVFEGNEIPAIPKHNITRLNFREVPLSANGRRGMAADVSLSLVNTYPIKLTIPPLGFDILVPGCNVDDPHIVLADATTGTITVEPFANVEVKVGGIVRELPKTLMDPCPDSHSSPLDMLLSDYIHGNDTTVFVRGSNAPDPDTPDWVTKIISSVTVPVPFPGHTFDDLIKNFTLTDTKIGFPNPFAQPGSDDEDITVSGNIVVMAALPREMNFGINVSRVHADADVFFEGRKLGILDLTKWQKAKSERVEPANGDDALLKIQSWIRKAPLKVMDQDVFQDLFNEYLLGDKVILLKVKALVYVEVSTVLGDITIKKLPAEGDIPVKPLPIGTGFSSLMPKIGELKVLSSTKTALNLEALVNFTNPTEYTAHIPLVSIHILNNGSIIGEATVKNITVVTGNNTNIQVQATWDPSTFGGQKAAKIGRELLSQYISGFNTTLTFRTHKGSIPNHPELGEALSKFSVEIPTPKLSGPSTGDGNGDQDHKPHFIDDATFHLFSSTATFTLISPLQYSTIYIEHINATAFYNHTEPVGQILYDLPFKVPPGSSQSPKLPVDWSFDSVGYEALRNALGGTLKLDAKGVVSVRLGQWTESIWYAGSGIGASVRF